MQFVVHTLGKMFWLLDNWVTAFAVWCGAAMGDSYLISFQFSFAGLYFHTLQILNT